MEQEKIYEIFTDASFDEKTKISTYAIVVMQDKKIIKAYAKKCKVVLENSTECEIYAIYQAINIIESNLLNNKIIQKFWLSTDCIEAKDFFEKQKMKIFKQNLKLNNEIKESYKRISNKMEQNEYNFDLKWIPRNLNKMAHKFSYNEFKKLKHKTYNQNILMLERKKLLQFLKQFNSKQCKVLIYLYLISNQDKIVDKTQNEVSKSLGMPNSSINRIFKELKELKLLQKISNGKYLLLL